MRRSLTFEQIFEGRIHLLSAMRHLLQEHGFYVKGQVYFTTGAGADAVHIVHEALTELEREFKEKRSRRRAA